MPELSGIWGISIRECRRGQESPEVKAVLLGDARPDAVGTGPARSIPARSPDQKNRRLENAMLEIDDIQHFLLTRTPALAARYEFLSFSRPDAGRAWLAGLIDKVGTGKSVGSASPDSRWVTLAFTWNGLRALGLDEASLATFPEEFR